MRHVNAWRQRDTHEQDVSTHVELNCTPGGTEYSSFEIKWPSFHSSHNLTDVTIVYNDYSLQYFSYFSFSSFLSPEFVRSSAVPAWPLLGDALKLSTGSEIQKVILYKLHHTSDTINIVKAMR